MLQTTKELTICITEIILTIEWKEQAQCQKISRIMAVQCVKHDIRDQRKLSYGANNSLL